jgi:hypothetical protein
LLLGPSDGRFGQVMVPFVRGQRMVPSRTEPVSDHSRLELEFLRPFSVSKKRNCRCARLRPVYVEAAGLQIRPPDAAQLRSLGQRMVPTGRTRHGIRL